MIGSEERERREERGVEVFRQRGRGRTPLRANEIHLGNLHIDDPFYDDSVPQNMLAEYVGRSHSDSEDSGPDLLWAPYRDMSDESFWNGGARPRSNPNNNSNCNNGAVGGLSASPPGTGGTAGGFFNWQATKSSLVERFSFMFNNEVLSDVHFVVGREPRQRIPAHKLVLTAGSAVFDAMFNGTLATTAEEIELPDVEPSAFLALLRFLYSDEVQIGPETVMTTLYTAKKYAVPALEGHCVDFLKSNLRPDNALMLLTQARLFDEPQLAALCFHTIDKNTSEAISADGFTDIDLETLCAVLERDTLHIRESKLYQAVIRWCENRCAKLQLPPNGENMRNVLGQALYLLRFPLMGIEEFAQGPAQSGLLCDREVVSLFLYFTVNPKPTLRFKDTPRCSLTGKEQSVNRFQNVESRWGYSGTSDRIRFQVDRRIFVVGFGLYGSIHGSCEYDVTIQVVLSVSGKVCGANSTTVTCDGTSTTFKVMFKEPIEVRPHTHYLAVATIKGTDSHYGTRGMRKVTVECTSGGRVTFQFNYAAGNNNGTSVEDGQIPEILFYI